MPESVVQFFKGLENSMPFMCMINGAPKLNKAKVWESVLTSLMTAFVLGGIILYGVYRGVEVRLDKIDESILEIKTEVKEVRVDVKEMRRDLYRPTPISHSAPHPKISNGGN